MKAASKSVFLAAAGLAAIARGEGTFINFETAPVHPVALSSDGQLLAVCNLPDGRVELFDVCKRSPQRIGSVPVGIDPVSIRFRDTSEAWVINHISSTVSILAATNGRVVATLDTLVGPADVVFAGSPMRAFVSCTKQDTVQVFDPISRVAVTNVAILGNRPKAMAVSADGSEIYVAILESGNASTIAALVKPQAVSPDPDDSPVQSLLRIPWGPYGGQVPPPNIGTSLVPALYREPFVVERYSPTFYEDRLPDSIIVKRNATGRWMDDNSGDWTEFISGTNAAMTGRVRGWDIPDRDLAIIDTATLEVRYATGLMNICMDLAVNPASGNVTVVGTDGTNERRFEPRLRGTFLRVNLASVNPSTLAKTVIDLNPHLDYSTSSVPQSVRDLSVGDPRGIVWNASGTRGYVTGMGSRNMVVIGSDGQRVVTAPVELGEGPSGMALDEPHQRLYVLNRFSSTLSVLDTESLAIRTNVTLFDPTPASIKIGRKHLYDTRRNSGLGHVSCGSCHVDARFDRLGWDLSDPTASTYIPNFYPFQNEAFFHPLKGPLVTQTLQGISAGSTSVSGGGVTTVPLHWRGDRQTLQNFAGTFTNLLGADHVPTTNEMTEFNDFLSTIIFPPNRLRNFDNTFATDMPLSGFYGRNPSNGVSDRTFLPNGNPRRGADLFANTRSHAGAASCAECHKEISGVGDEGEELLTMTRATIGNLKAAQLRSVQDKLGFDLSSTNSRAGFGLRFDGRADTVTGFLVSLFDEQFRTNQDIADITAFVLSSFPQEHHASLARQTTLSRPGPDSLVEAMRAIAYPTNHLELVAHGVKEGLNRSWYLDRTIGAFQSDRNDETITWDNLLALAGPGQELTFMLVAEGTGGRLGNDHDEDGIFDRTELDLGLDPADRLSNSGNSPPRLLTATNVMVHPGMAILIPFTAVDPDSPPQRLRYRLTLDAPSGATLDPTNGLFNWRPTPEQEDETFQIGVEAADDGVPPLWARTIAEVHVVPFRVIGVIVAPKLDIVNIQFQAVPGQRYQLQFKDHLNAQNWSDGAMKTADVFRETFFHFGYANLPQRFYRIVRLE